jgi:CheY-like chemotaxis protein
VKDCAEGSEIEGTGIGMMVTRQLVELMQGHIDFDSKVGEGSLFWVDFTLVQGTDVGTENRETGAGLPATCSGKQPGIRVLYIEDNIANVKLMEQVFLRQTQYRLTSAMTPVEGLDIARSSLPDVILLDINMPGMDGYQVLEHLKASDETAGIPVIAVTANAMAENISRGLEAGFHDYITKPIDINRLLSSLEAVLQS